jgi:hypothetical protein
MALADYFKGPKHKAEATRLAVDLETHRKRSETEIQALQSKFEYLEAKMKELGVLDLLAIQEKVKNEEIRWIEIQSRISAGQNEIASVMTKLKSIQQQILGAEDTVLLESLGLYTPKYQLTNSIDYKAQLESIREDQKQSARRLSAEVDSWDNSAVQLTKAQWKKLRKDALKLALRSFNSESEYCVDNVKFSNLEKMEERIRRSFETCNKLLSSIDAWWKDIVLERKLQELYLAHEYQVKRQEEKESARQAR